uniref:Uncharacterized protein n=1 Tax=Oryza rufipogon TaxID=4529 RepID=A0A0E0R6Y4_ORYRU
MYKPCQRPSYRHVPPPLSPLAPIPSSLRSPAHPQIAPPPLPSLLSLSHTRKAANHAAGDPSPRPQFAAAQLLSRRPVSENSGAAEPEFESPSNPPAVLPPLHVARSSSPKILWLLRRLATPTAPRPPQITQPSLSSHIAAPYAAQDLPRRRHAQPPELLPPK